ERRSEPLRYLAAGTFVGLGFIPQGVHLLKIAVCGSFTLRCEPLLDVVEAAGEFLIGPSERSFRIDPEMPGNIGYDKQEIAELFGHALQALSLPRLVGTARIVRQDGFLQLRQFLPQLVEHGCQTGPIEPDPCGFPLQLDSPYQSRKGQRDIAQKASFSATRWLCPVSGDPLFGLSLFGLLRSLDPLPRAFLQALSPLLWRAENMRMPAQHLPGDAIRDIVEIEGADLLGHARVID